MKKAAGMICAAMMMLCGTAGMFPALGQRAVTEPITAKAAASDYTADDAINWVKSKNNQTLEVNDPSNYAQCVDLTMGYYDFLGVPRCYGNGNQYATFDSAVPPGWTRTKGGIPQKGDILVYANNANHVAIYESDYSTWHQNFNSHSYVEQITNQRYDSWGYWGCIHPNFASDKKWYDDYTLADLGQEFYANIENTSSHLQLSYDGSNALACKKEESSKQLWHFVKQADGGYSILNQESGLSLDIANYGTANGTNIQMLPFTGNTAQHFYLYLAGNGFLIRPACSDLVFDTEGYDSKKPDTADSYNLAIYPLDDYFDSKRFSIVKQYADYPSADPGTDFDARIKNAASGLFFTADGSNVNCQKENNDDTQVWHFQRNPDSSYFILNKKNGYSMDIVNYGTANGTNVSMMPLADNTAQRFYLYDAGNGVLIRPACSDLVFDAEGYDSKSTEVQAAYNLATYPLDDYLDNKVFLILKETASLSGDANDDGNIDLKDVTVMRRALAGWNVTVNADAADINKDGSFDLKDVVTLRRYLAGGWDIVLK